MPKLHPETSLQPFLERYEKKELQRDALAFVCKLGLEIAKALLQAEVEEKCGPRNRKDSARKAVRWGSELGSITVRGTKESISKPRMRTPDGSSEIQLESYGALADTAWLDDKMLNAIINGVSTRNYARMVEKPLRRRGVSRSAVSRRTIAASKPQIDAFLQRNLEGSKFHAILVDGIHFAKRQMIVAIGVTLSGRKQVIGMRLGATENIVVTRDLISDLIARGLDPEQRYLFVVDGSKALKQAISATFGDRAVFQRCQEHKIRNVLAYLPRKYHEEFRAKLQAAYSQSSFPAATKRLDQIRTQLQRISYNAAQTLTEGMYETLTLRKLGITGSLYKSLRTTNAIESAFSAARRHTCRTTSFRDEQQIYRWAARGLLCAEQNFRIVPGHRQIAKLKAELESYETASLFS